MACSQALEAIRSGAFVYDLPQAAGLPTCGAPVGSAGVSLRPTVFSPSTPSPPPPTYGSNMAAQQLFALRSRHYGVLVIINKQGPDIILPAFYRLAPLSRFMQCSAFGGACFAGVFLSCTELGLFRVPAPAECTQSAVGRATAQNWPPTRVGIAWCGDAPLQSLSTSGQQMGPLHNKLGIGGHSSRDMSPSWHWNLTNCPEECADFVAL